MLNKTQIIGRLGNDPECSSTQGGTAVATLSVATSEKWRDKQTGEQKEKTTWHNVKAFGKLAEIIQQYLKKGSQVYIEGSSYTDKYQDSSGQDKYYHYIQAREMKMLDIKSDGKLSQGAAKPPADDFINDKIPF